MRGKGVKMTQEVCLLQIEVKQLCLSMSLRTKVFLLWFKIEYM